MKRWHEERVLMLRRWKMEMEKHDYDWRNPPDPKCDKRACHCAAGIGSMRKRRPYDCGNPRCGLCHFEKFWIRKNRYNKLRKIIEFELEVS